MKYRLATEAERRQYKDDGGVYPLHALIHRDDGHTLRIEDLRCWSRGDPQWEVRPPRGYHFYLEGTHAMLEFTIRDCKYYANSPLAKCDDACCGEFYEINSTPQT